MVWDRHVRGMRRRSQERAHRKAHRPLHRSGGKASARLPPSTASLSASLDSSLPASIARAQRESRMAREAQSAGIGAAASQRITHTRCIPRLRAQVQRKAPAPAHLRGRGPSLASERARTRHHACWRARATLWHQKIPRGAWTATHDHRAPRPAPRAVVPSRSPLCAEFSERHPPRRGNAALVSGTKPFAMRASDSPCMRLCASKRTGGE